MRRRLLTVAAVFFALMAFTPCAFAQTTDTITLPNGEERAIPTDTDIAAYEAELAATPMAADATSDQPTVDADGNYHISSAAQFAAAISPISRVRLQVLPILRVTTQLSLVSPPIVS